MELTLEEALEKAVEAHKAGQVQEALPYFKIALEANPSIGQFWLSHIDSGCFTPCVQSFTSLFRLVLESH
jgi:hypothetical protein